MKKRLPKQCSRNDYLEASEIKARMVFYNFHLYDCFEAQCPHTRTPRENLTNEYFSEFLVDSFFNSFLYSQPEHKNFSLHPI